MTLCTQQEINYDSPRGVVSVITEKGEVTTSYLLIQKAKISDSGKYTCLPTHANPSTVNVHVLNGMYKIVHTLYIVVLVIDHRHSEIQLVTNECNIGILYTHFFSRSRP